MNHTTEAVSIIMLDDHELVLEGLKKVLEDMPQVAVAHTAASSCELLRKSKEREYDIYLIDIELVGENGLDVLQTIRKSNPRARFIVCTMHEEIWTLHSLLRHHPEGVVLKLSGTKAIKEAVQVLCEGKTYRCPRFRNCYQYLENAELSSVKKNLPTRREQEVLEGIARGLSSAEIARRLYLTENTVEGYRKSLMLKLGARNATDLVVKALDCGLLDMPHDVE